MNLILRTLVLKPRQFTVPVLVLIGGCVLAVAESNWPRWRGPRDNGSTGTGTYPVKWELGSVFVIKADGSFELLAENDLGERVIASPVPVLNRLFLRGEQHLFCIAGR